jgi:predicted alpha-1,2-mannosidase
LPEIIDGKIQIDRRKLCMQATLDNAPTHADYNDWSRTMRDNCGWLFQRMPLKKKGAARLLSSALCALGFLSLAVGSGVGQAGPASDVNPFVGTGRSAGSPYANASDVNLFPGAVMPFGMVQLSPDTENNGFGYHYGQDTMQGFSMTHMSGAGCPNSGEVFFTPTTGPVDGQVSDYASPYSHDRESASPGFYQVHLSRWNADVELSATTRTGSARMTFPGGQAANLLIPISHTLNHTMASSVHIVDDHKIEGYVVNRVFCRRTATYKVHFVMTFDRPFSTFGTWEGKQAIQTNNRSAEQADDTKQIGAYVTWPATAKSQTVTAHIAISYVDSAGAEKNLKAEASGKTFDQIHTAATKSWNDELNLIEVSGGTARDRRVFYTSLYHALLMPSTMSDADGRYIGFDDKIHSVAAGHDVYGNYSGWDIYRNQMPLVAMIEPRRMEDMAQSVVLQYQQGGWIGKWPQANRYTNVMVGSPLTVILATAWLDGLHGFDMDTGWKGMLVDATQAAPPGKPYEGETGIDWINRLHFAPDDQIKHGSVSQLLENTIAYASLYRVAVDLGKKDEAKMLYDRALYYRNTFNPEDRFFRPRNADGKWVEPFDPTQNKGFVEGSAWHYQWAAPWDMKWLINAVGKDLFNERLISFFDYKKPSWTAKYYNPYNETDLQAPFEFNFSGQPWRAQKAVRRVLEENYQDTPDGAPGNDDCGAMSSWAVLSMMGIYSVDPASLAYELVSPTFSKVVVNLRAPYKGKAFTITTSPDPQNNPYIQSVELNGNKYSRNWIPFQAISSGSSLHFSLGTKPDLSWGTAPSDIPPSLSDSQP